MISKDVDTIHGYLGGKEKSFGFLVGQVMRYTNGRANPQLVNQLLKERLVAKPPDEPGA